MRVWERMALKRVARGCRVHSDWTPEPRRPLESPVTPVTFTHILKLVNPSVDSHAVVAPALPVILHDLRVEQVAHLLRDILLNEQVERGRAVLGRHCARERSQRLEVPLDRLGFGHGGKNRGAQCRLAADAV